jgi:hypothetical protein
MPIGVVKTFDYRKYITISRKYVISEVYLQFYESFSNNQKYEYIYL